MQESPPGSQPRLASWAVCSPGGSTRRQKRLAPWTQVCSSGGALSFIVFPFRVPVLFPASSNPSTFNSFPNQPCCFFVFCFKLWSRARASAQSLSRARLFATPWTVARQAPLSMGFSRRESWSGLHALLRGSSAPGPEPAPLTSPLWRAASLPLEPPGKARTFV